MNPAPATANLPFRADQFPMKSAYELAMERLEKQSPAAKVTDEQRHALAEIDATYKAKIAEREVFPLVADRKGCRRTQRGMEVENIRVQLAQRGAPLAGRM